VFHLHLKRPPVSVIQCFICRPSHIVRSNHVGNYRWTSALQWSGHKAFNAEELREWKVDGKVAGMTRSAHGLTFATVFGAGHMVCGIYSLLKPLAKIY
jgi:carboxypeptidase C (cathepsin A)